MRPVYTLLAALALAADVGAQEVKRDIPYVEKGHERQVLDVYSPPGAKNLPVVFWIHGGGWQAGDKSDVQIKPKVFTEKGFVFVATQLPPPARGGHGDHRPRRGEGRPLGG